MLLTSFRTCAQLAPHMIGAGLAMVLIAQFVPGVPLAAAILLIGYGSTGWFATNRGAHRQPWIVLNGITYLMIGNLTLAAQLYAAPDFYRLALVADLLAAVLLGAAMFAMMLQVTTGHASGR